MNQEYASVIFVARECYVYRIPPRTTAGGYRAAEWGDMEKYLWKGRLRIVEHTDICEIRLEDSESGELFAACPYDVSGTSVEPVLDSSRYFVLRVESDGPEEASKRKAYIGLGFLERSESFDFTVALQDWTRRQKAATRTADDDEEERPSPHLPPGPRQDFSLKEGQKVSINLPALQDKKPSEGLSSTKAGTAIGAPGFIFPPPPSAKRT